VDLDSVAGELYGLPPDEFTAARDTRAGEARSAGDRDLAAAIKKLRRPTAGAWLANLLVRERPEQVGELLELGAQMRRAQAGLAAGELRQLSQRRRQVVAALAGEARGLGAGLRRPVSEAAARELEATLEAAVADPGASDALRHGRLTTALRYSGFGLDGLTQPGSALPARAASSPAEAAPPEQKPAPATGRRPPADRASRERIQAARRELRAAQAAAATAERAAGSRERRLGDARTEQDRIQRQVAALERRLGDLRESADQAGRDLADAEHAQQEAADEVRGARDRVSRAETALDQLTRPGG
jgi:hypothetical protein